jgi:PadR family transcriptional regulator PadR
MSRLKVMQRNRPPSAQTINVLRALAADPAQWRYGYDLATQVQLKSGSLYPILVRLADRGLLETAWEQGEGSRPPRHLYRLTATGREYVTALPAVRVKKTVPRSAQKRLSEA